VDYALKEGWISNTAKNYTDNISRREFVNLLRNSLPENSKSLLDDCIDYEGDSIYKENLPTSRKEAALICYKLLSKLSPSSTYIPVPPNIPDDADLQDAYREAANLVVSAGILGQNTTPFNPNGLVSYEQALAMLYRIRPIINIYSDYNVVKLNPAMQTIRY
jgi:hypothetical protein